MASAKVQIELDRTRSIVFDMDALEALESALNGIPLVDVIGRLRGVSLPTLVIALWAGLRADDKTLTINLVKKIVNKAIFTDGRTYAELSEPVAEALDRSGLFRQDDDAQGNVSAAAAPTS